MKDKEKVLNSSINKLPNQVQNDIVELVRGFKGKSKEDNIKDMLAYKKKFDKYNIDQKLKGDIAKIFLKLYLRKKKNLLNNIRKNNRYIITLKGL
ncbi:MAG: hypothetical protein ACK5LV_11500 [Lachnospirales bacterium]